MSVPVCTGYYYFYFKKKNSQAYLYHGIYCILLLNLVLSVPVRTTIFFEKILTDVGSYLGTSTSTTVYILLLSLLVSVSVCATIRIPWYFSTFESKKKKLTDVYLYHGTTVYIVLVLL
eukprot:SAG11_NODE_1804_length_4234_cov_20.948730_5_plen_117_part_01